MPSPSCCSTSCTADRLPWPRSWRSSAIRHADRLRARRLDDVDGLADGGAGGDDIVDDQHATGERRADDVAALAMVLRLLAVERVGDIAFVFAIERGGDQGASGMPL